MSGLSPAADLMHPALPTLRFICPIGESKVRQLEKQLHRSNSAARGQIAFKYRKCGWRLRNCQKPLKVKSKMADDAQIFFNKRVPISFERLKLETSNSVCASTTRSDFDAKIRSKGSWPSLSDLDFKPVDPCEYLSNG